MIRTPLSRNAWRVLLLNALYHTAEAFCSVFVGVYFYVHSLDFAVVCYHYLALFTVTPCVFLLAGWYSQVRDRVHVFRFGLILHAVYYGALLVLRDQAASHPVLLGATLGVAWGFFWAGNNTLNYDATEAGNRDRFFGWLSALTGSAKLVAPLVSGAILALAPGDGSGFTWIFLAALILYLGAIYMSFRMPADNDRRPFKLGRALFPGPEQRDWRLVMAASATLAGSFYILHFMLALLLFMQTSSEFGVGSFAAAQALIGIAVSYLLGRFIVPRTRKYAMRGGVVLLLMAGLLILFRFDVLAIVVFGCLRSISMPLFGIPHASIRFDVIAKSVADPAQRIEYLCAWEVPLALGRIVTMVALLLMAGWLDEWGIRIVIFLLCANRVLTYALLSQTSVLQRER